MTEAEEKKLAGLCMDRLEDSAAAFIIDRDAHARLIGFKPAENDVGKITLCTLVSMAVGKSTRYHMMKYGPTERFSMKKKIETHKTLLAMFSDCLVAAMTALEIDQQ